MYSVLERVQFFMVKNENQSFEKKRKDIVMMNDQRSVCFSARERIFVYLDYLSFVTVIETMRKNISRVVSIFRRKRSFYRYFID